LPISICGLETRHRKPVPEHETHVSGCLFTPLGRRPRCVFNSHPANGLYLMSSIPTTAAMGGESFADLFAESLKNQDMKSGEVISAEVVRIDHNFVVVNAGLKSEALIPVEE